MFLNCESIVLTKKGVVNTFVFKYYSPMKRKTDYLHIRIEPELKRDIQHAAEVARLSMSEFVAREMRKKIEVKPDVFEPA